MLPDQRQNRDTYGQRVIELAVARVFGSSMKETAKVLGISERGAWKFLAANRDQVDAVAAFITPHLKETKHAIEVVAAADFKSTLEKRLGGVVAAFDKGLASDDKYLDAADKVAAHVIGKPTSTVNVNGQVNHLHAQVVLPPETVAAMSGVIAMSGSLYGRAQALLPPSQATVDVSAG